MRDGIPRRDGRRDGIPRRDGRRDEELTLREGRRDEELTLGGRKRVYPAGGSRYPAQWCIYPAQCVLLGGPPCGMWQTAGYTVHLGLADVQQRLPGL